jgi:hypothetical protein
MITKLFLRHLVIAAGFISLAMIMRAQLPFSDMGVIDTESASGESPAGSDGSAAGTLAGSLSFIAKPRFDRLDWILLSSDAGARTLDAMSTRWDLSNPCHCFSESSLPPLISNHLSTMLIYGDMVVSTNYLMARYFIRHHHPRLVQIGLTFDPISDGRAAINNLILLRRARYTH